MKRRAAFLVSAFLSLFIVLNAAFSQPSRTQGVIEVRLASPLPRNSDWGRELDRIAAEWARVTNNQVRLRVIHDGVEGSDAVMLSKLKSNNIQAALLTSAGIAEICPAAMTLSVPFLISNNAEIDTVYPEVLPILDEYMTKTNFVSVCWAKGGWVNIFSKEPIFTPDDLRRQRLSSSPEMTDINTAFRTVGFTVVESDLVDVGTRIASNTINAIYLIPEALAPLGLHRTLTNMLDLPIAPVLGAIIMNRVTWNKLGPQRQQDLMRATQRIVSDFETRMRRTSANAISAMKKEGLKVNVPNAAQENQWRTEMGMSMPSLFSSTIDRNIYSRINSIVERARNRQ